MPSPQEVLKDPEFRQLPFEEKLKVFNQIDPDFRGLPLGEQRKAMMGLIGTDVETLQTGAPGPASRFRGTEAALEKGLDETFFENAPEITGGTVGGMAGTPGGIPGRVGGAALGGAIGKTGQELYRGNRDPMAIAKEAGLAALRQGGGQLIGEGITGVAGRLMRPFAKTVTPGISPAREAFEAKGGQYLPSQVTESRLLDYAENIAEGGMGSSGTIAAFRKGQQKVINQWADDLANSFGNAAAPEEIGTLVMETLKGKADAFHAMGKGLFKQVDNLMTPSNPLDAYIQRQAGGSVVIRDLKNAAVGLKKGVSLTPSPSGETLLDKVANLPDRVTFETAQSLRSELLGITRGEHGSRAEAVARLLTKKVDDSMVKTAENLSGEALEAWRTANQFWKQGKETFENRFIKSLMKKDPEHVIDTVVKSGKVTTIKKLKAALEGEDILEFQSGVTRKLLTEATDKEGNIQANLLLGKLKTLTEPTLKEIYSESQLTGIRNFANAVELAQKRSSDAPGKMWIQLAQGGAIVDLAAAMFGMGGFAPKPLSTAVMIAPPVFAKMLTNRTTANWLTEGVLTEATSSKAGTMARRILAEAVKLGGRGAVTMLGSGEPAPIPEATPTTPGPQTNLKEKVFDVGEGIRSFMKKPISEMFGG